MGIVQAKKLQAMTRAELALVVLEMKMITVRLGGKVRLIEVQE
jgi:hypothetical protein